ATLGRSVRIQLPGGDELRGRAVDLDVDGRLIVDTGSERRVVDVGDVVHLRPDEPS
ncbi:MAG: biotin--[acetyl-CoA-carboxylase] ligase, partial [Actinomycetota bacterium]